MRSCKRTEPGTDLAVAKGGLWIAAAAPLALAACSGASATVEEEALFAVRRADLRVTVLEGGSFESEVPGKILNEIEGQTTILWLVPEGTTVQTGDKLVELDASSLDERLTQQRIRYEETLAAKIRAERELEIQKSTWESNVKEAELEVLYADLDLLKYRQGDYVKAKESAGASITLAKEEIQRADDRLSWSQRLAEKGYITRLDLQADQLAKTRREFDLKLSELDLEVFDKYEHKKNDTKYEADLEEAKRQLDRVKARREAALAQAEAEVRSRTATFDLEKEKLEKYQRQLARATIHAERGGLVVYAREGEGRGMRMDQRPIEPGAQVRERQAILMLPDMNRMMAKLSIHESAVDRVRPGLPAVVRVDAFPDEPFPGVVTKVATVPDSQSMWYNPDLKVYSTEVRLLRQSEGRLRPGMSCSVEIESANLKDVVAIPLQAVRDNGSEQFCFVRENGKPVVREVKLGLHNDRLVHVREGVAEGESVYLAVKNPPPLPAPRGAPMPELSEIGEPAISPPPAAEAPGADLDGDPSAPRRSRGRGGFEGMSEAEREEMRRRFEAMTPEERAAAMRQFRERGGERRGGEAGRSDRTQGGSGSPSGAALEGPGGSERDGREAAGGANSPPKN